MKLKSVLAAATLAAFAAGFAVAADNRHEAREDLMKSIGKSMGALSAIAKGDNPYDAEVVKASLAKISESAKAFPDQFPVGSEKDDEEASPKIWENMDDFKAKAAKLGADADGLIAQLPADGAGVGAALGVLGPNCGGCHEVYRIKK
ncbi:c-type cytochrome [Pararhizobium sp.]|uniref:c-type cytochrome n=1 Tax=Pararhizobium sp. TaxID=1977563 RepID=UPI002721DF17|nr:cytochrome c [Pararhizobium sp.]MDO9417267.1 cytochrome c [Pararhizobium sp.]